MQHISSKIKNYFLEFNNSSVFDEDFFVIDRNVYEIHLSKFKKIDISKIIFIDAFETNKTYLKCASYIEQLMNAGVRRGHTIAAIGGGITQDIVGFITSILYRGLNWNFYPTTLLSQCDSCIGGKTSINLGEFKNIVGNFNPPDKVTIDMSYLETLEKKDVQSGLGEILKVSFIDKKNRINQSELTKSIINNKVNKKLLMQSLEIKKEIIEIDEFDKGLRNIMNYGHTFGHAIETLTNFKIPHGIAVGLGIDIANNISKKIYESSYKEIENTLKTFLNVNNFYYDIFRFHYNEGVYMNALSKDKKNTHSDSIKCILLKSQGNPCKLNIKASELKKYLKIKS